MSTSQPDPPPGPRAEQQTTDGANRVQHSDTPPPDKSLLERVLHETISPESMQPEELSALIEVGRRYCGQPLSLHPIAVELVDAILKFRVAHIATSDQLRRHMSEQIAESLLDDPQSEERLEGFWNRLVEAAR